MVPLLFLSAVLGRGLHAANIHTRQADYTGDVQLPGCPPIVTRAQWGARLPKEAPVNLPRVPVYMFIHHGAGSECFDNSTCVRKVQEYQNLHMSPPRDWNDIAYNFVVGENGIAYQGRGWSSVGAHTKGYNDVGLAICIIGDFTNHVPNDAALNTVKQLIQCALDNGKLTQNYTLKGHRDVGTTECPGTAYYNLIHSWPHFVPGTGLWTPRK